MEPLHDGQLSDSPVRSLAMRCRACAGLYVAGRGFRMGPPGLVRNTRGSGNAASGRNLTSKERKSKWHIDLRSVSATGRSRISGEIPAEAASPTHAFTLGREETRGADRYPLVNARAWVSVARLAHNCVSMRGCSGYSQPCGRRQMRRPTRQGRRELTLISRREARKHMRSSNTIPLVQSCLPHSHE